MKNARVSGLDLMVQKRADMVGVARLVYGALRGLGASRFTATRAVLFALPRVKVDPNYVPGEPRVMIVEKCSPEDI
jgi:hypothetical protein